MATPTASDALGELVSLALCRSHFTDQITEVLEDHTATKWSTWVFWLLMHLLSLFSSVIPPASGEELRRYHQRTFILSRNSQCEPWHILRLCIYTLLLSSSGMFSPQWGTLPISFDKSMIFNRIFLIMLEIDKIMLTYQRNTQAKYIVEVVSVNYFEFPGSQSKVYC